MGTEPQNQTEQRTVRAVPRPRHGGLLVLLHFMAKNRMLHWRYGVMLLRLGWLKLRLGKRLQTDGIVFIGKDVTFEIGKHAAVQLGRWSWIGRNTRIRAHEGVVQIGAKTVLGEECTLTAY